MYTGMDWCTKILLEVLRGEKSKRQILRREGIHWETLKKILEHSEPPGYRIENPRPKPKIGPFLEQIEQIIESEKIFQRNSVTLPSVYTSASRRWVTRVNIPRSRKRLGR